MTNLNKANANFANIDTKLETLTSEKNDGIAKCIDHIKAEITTLKTTTGLNNRKARKIVKDTILDGNENKATLRAYSIAFTMVNRDVEVLRNVLTISQTENLVKHGTVARINELALNYAGDFPTYKEEVLEYLKQLKTRETKVMAYEKIKK